MKWTDNAFQKIFWEPLPCFKRPSHQQLTQAVRFFVYNYAQGKARSSAPPANVDDWRNTLRTLLLGLSNNNNKNKNPDNQYILANEDANKGEGQRMLPAVPAIKETVVPPLADNWSMVWFQSADSPAAHLYFGCLTLILCRLITEKATFLTARIEDILPRLLQLFCLWRQVEENRFRVLPTFPKQLFAVLDSVFDCSGPFAKEIVCRLTQRRIELNASIGKRSKIRSIQNLACYDTFKRDGSGLLGWYLLAQRQLGASNEVLLETLTIPGYFNRTVIDLKAALPLLNDAPLTWRICQLMHGKCCTGLQLSDKRNYLALITFRAASAASDRITQDCAFPKNMPSMRVSTSEFKLGCQIGSNLKNIFIQKVEKLNQK